MKLPVQSVRCCLKGIRPIGESWTENTNVVIEELIGEEAACTFHAAKQGEQLLSSLILLEMFLNKEAYDGYLRACVAIGSMNTT